MTESPERGGGFGERVLARLVRSQIGERFAQHALTARTEARRAQARELRDQSGDQWRRGERDEAIDALRRALLIHPDSSDVWLLYAQRLIEAGKPQAAHAALCNALDVDPANLTALEILYDTTRLQRVSKRPFRRALERLADCAPNNPDKHRGMLDFAIPHQSPALLAALEQSSDPFTRYVVGLERGEAADRWSDRPPALERLPTGVLTPHDETIARATYALARGRIAAARAALSSIAPDAYPVDAIRRAVRRSSAQEKHTAVVGALRLYVSARPNDPWAVKKLAVSEQLSAANDAHASILRRGYVFPAPEAAAYVPRREKSFYLLHNSLPETSNGYATRSHGLLSGMIRSGWDVDAMTRPGFPYDLPKVEGVDHPEAVVVDDVTYHRTASGRVPKEPVPEYIKLYSDAIVERADSERPFVIHGASNHVNGLAAVTAARRLGIPSIYEVRGLWEVTRASRSPEWANSDRYQLMKRLETDAARAADVVLTITGALKDELVARGVDESKISIVPNGVDASRFNPMPRDAALAAELGLEDRLVIGYVGSVLDYEGIGLLIEAAQLLATRRSDFRVLIVGDGAEREQFESMAAEQGVRDLVHFTGRVPHHDVERYYSLIDIAPFPRLPLPVCEMVSPLKPFEAMAMGKAVIASNVQALSEIVDDDVTGLLHVKGDAVDLARKLELLLDDRSLAASLGEAGRKWVRAERDWSVISERISEIYFQLGGRTSPSREGAV